MTHHRRKTANSPYHVLSESSFSTFKRRWAAERKITGNAVAYLTALYIGRCDFPPDPRYSTTHWRNRIAYGALDDDIRTWRHSLTGMPHLNNSGMATSDSLSPMNVTPRPPPGSSIMRDIHMSPKTFAKEVKISAAITSQKCTVWSDVEDKQRYNDL